MTDVMPVQAITCPACGEASFLKRSPVYDGFRKTGETLSCAACGQKFENADQLPAREDRKPALFDPADRPEPVRIFRSDEVGHCCRHCRHYVVNPFVQRCALHGREVEATDVCATFEKRTE